MTNYDYFSQIKRFKMLLLYEKIIKKWKVPTLFEISTSRLVAPSLTLQARDQCEPLLLHSFSINVRIET